MIKVLGLPAPPCPLPPMPTVCNLRETFYLPCLVYLNKVFPTITNFSKSYIIEIFLSPCHTTTLLARPQVTMETFTM